MRANLRTSEQIQKDSITYIKDNKPDVARTNQRTLIGVNIFYFFVLIGYYIASRTAFSSWNVSNLYMIACVTQLILLIFVILRYGWSVRSYREIAFTCTFFQLYAMAFVGIMCTVPVEMNQPAVYYSPIALGFVAAFIFTYKYTLALVAIEMFGYVIASCIVKTTEVMAVDFSSCLLTLLMATILARILYTQRTRENESRQRIRRMGMIDALAGLYNKSSTEFLCKNYMKKETTKSCALLVIDFDNFKQVNDTFGHQIGDVVLRSLGRILKNIAGENHVAGRIGGDEFTLLLKDVTLAEAEACAQEIMKQTRQIIAPNGTKPFTCSIGIAIKHSSADHYSDLFERADQVLYKTKKSGKNNYTMEA